MANSFFCDYYRGSSSWVPERVFPLLRDVVPVVGGDGVPVTVQPVYRGDVAMVRKIGSKRVLWAEWGGVYGDGCLFQASGLSGAADRLFEAIRGAEVPHRVQRVDVALDFEAEGVADLAFGIAQDLAEEHKLKVGHEGDWRPDGQRVGGRTLYLGSRKSEFFLRLYEKGLHPDFVGDGRPNWFRIECEYKPEKGPQKREAAHLGLAEIFCSRTWAAHLVEKLGLEPVQVERIGRKKHSPDQERAVRALVSQYRRTWEGLRALCGKDENVGVYLGIVQELMQQTGGIHGFNELSDAGSMARFIAEQTHSRESENV